MPLDFDTFSAQLSSITDNSKNLYLNNDTTLKGAGYWGTHFRSQQKFNNAVSTFCDILESKFQSQGLGALAQGIRTSLNGTTQITAGMAKVLLGLTEHFSTDSLKVIGSNPDNIRLLMSALKPCFQRGVAPSETYASAVQDIITSTPLTLWGGTKMLANDVEDKQAKIDILKSFYAPDEVVCDQLLLCEEGCDQQKALESQAIAQCLGAVPELKAKYPHGNLTPAMFFDARFKNGAAVSWKASKVNGKKGAAIRKLYLDFVEKEYELSYKESKMPKFSRNSFWGNRKPDRFWQTAIHFCGFLMKSAHNFVKTDVTKTPLTITEKDLRGHSLIKEIMAEHKRYCPDPHKHYEKAPSYLISEDLYPTVLNNLRSVNVTNDFLPLNVANDGGKQSANLTLTFVSGDGQEPVTATIGKKLDVEMSQKYSSGRQLRDQCENVLDKINAQCSSYAQQVNVMLVLSSCGKVEGQRFLSVLFPDDISKVYSERRAFNISVSKLHDGTMAVKYILEPTVAEQCGNLELNFHIAPNGQITKSGFTWQQPANPNPAGIRA